MAEGNGHGELVPARVATLTLTYVPHTAHLEVNGDTGSVDEALNMLAQAARYFEDQRRMQVVAQMQQSIQEQARVQAVRATMNKRG